VPAYVGEARLQHVEVPRALQRDGLAERGRMLEVLRWRYAKDGAQHH